MHYQSHKPKFANNGQVLYSIWFFVLIKSVQNYFRNCMYIFNVFLVARSLGNHFARIFFFLNRKKPDSLRCVGKCPVPDDHPSQAASRWVNTWIGDSRSVSCTSKRCVGGHFSKNIYWRQTLFSGRLYRHRFSAVSLCPRANAIQHWRERLRPHSKGGKLWLEEIDRKKKGRDRWKGWKRRGRCIRQLPYRCNY